MHIKHIVEVQELSSGETKIYLSSRTSTNVEESFEEVVKLLAPLEILK